MWTTAGQIAHIIRDGVAEGAFRAVDADAAAWAVFGRPRLSTTRMR
jgi:hypothetical protein